MVLMVVGASVVKGLGIVGVHQEGRLKDLGGRAHLEGGIGVDRWVWVGG